MIELLTKYPTYQTAYRYISLNHKTLRDRIIEIDSKTINFTSFFIVGAASQPEAIQKVFAFYINNP
jgi:hypothetical protein